MNNFQKLNASEMNLIKGGIDGWDILFDDIFHRASATQATAQASTQEANA